MPSITIKGLRFNYRLEGPEGAPVIAFSNSLGTNLAMWDAQAKALSGQFRCLRYDTRGHGETETSAPGFGVEDLADDLAELLAGLGIAKAHVVGLSLGGMTGQILAATRPELVDKLVLVATSAHMPPPELWFDRARIVRAQGLAAIAESVIARWFTPAMRASEGAATTRHLLETAIDPMGYANCCEAIGRMDNRGLIGAIKAPTLVISGEEDPATPVTMGEELQRLIPGARFLAIKDAAHLIAVERPQELTAEIAAFLGGSGERRPTPVPADNAAAFQAGLANRKEVLGAAHVERSLSQAGDFAMPWQDFITRYAWGEIWGDDTLPWKTRSMIVLAITLALGKEEEFKLHLRPALKNGVTPEELRALLKQAAVYAGVPAANGAFRWARETLGDVLK